MSALRALTFYLVLPAAIASAQTDAPSPSDRQEDASKPGNIIFIGEVVADDVYVRSGPSLNHYPVTKLSSGDRVQVVDHRDDWLGLIPPDDTFSLIATSYVDTPDERRGVVNGNNVRVRAGSQIRPEEWYQVQLQLSRGAQVQILGKAEQLDSEHEYYRIKPPRGAKLWIHGDYVDRVPDSMLKLEERSRQHPIQSEPQTVIIESRQVASAPQAGSTPPASHRPSTTPEPSTSPRPANTDEPTVIDVPPGSGRSAGIDSPSANPRPSTTEPRESAELTVSTTPVSGRQIKDHRSRLDQLDARLQEELDKPLLHRDLAPLLAEFRELAETSPDAYTQTYADVRAKQITDMMDIISAVRGMRDLREEVKTTRTQAQAERSSIRPKPMPIRDGFDIQGELRVSLAFKDRPGPKRYRLVDPAKSPIRTIGYLEIPKDSPIDAEPFLGRLVGVRASDIYLETADVDPMKVYIPAEIVPLAGGADVSR